MLDLDLQRALALRAIRGNLARLKWHAAALRFELALRRHDRALKYNPNYDLQPRRPAGVDGAGEWTEESGSWVRVAGGPSRGGRGRFGADFPGATYGQLVRLDRTVAQSQDLLREVHRYDPNWQPTEPSARATPGSMEGAIRQAEARVAEVRARLDQLRSGIGGNLGPPLDAPVNARTTEFDGRAWIDIYRGINNSPDLFGRLTWPRNDGTVAVAEIDGRLYFGVNSTEAPFTSADRRDANGWRDSLASKYPDMNRGNAGWMPNDGVFHAEATILLRMARDNGGSLEGKAFEIHVDRTMCDSCNTVLPRLGLELGNPTVTYVDLRTGERKILRNGQWTR